MTNKDVRIAIVLLAGLALVGCGKSDPPPATQPAPASQPATQPSPAVLTVGGEPIEFAVTHLDVAREQDSLHLQLYGMDRETPPQSSFYFDMTLDAEDAESLPGKTWRMQAASDAAVDVNESAGIFLANNTIRMLPKEMKAEFSGSFPNVTVTLTGVMMREGNESQTVKASGTFTVLAKEKHN